MLEIGTLVVHITQFCGEIAKFVPWDRIGKFCVISPTVATSLFTLKCYYLSSNQTYTFENLLSNREMELAFKQAKILEMQDLYFPQSSLIGKLHFALFVMAM